ncbi:MAG TPA: hypothetical protein VIJ14_09390 [Rhabdochlamydiaceae bacterium]
MPKLNLNFFLNSYSDLCQTSTPQLNQFKWNREINGVPFTYENNQQIQVLPSITTSNVVPYPFSALTNSGDYTINSTTTLSISSSPAGIARGNLIIGASIPVNTTVINIAPTQYTFTVTSANATVGATYSNNGQTFTVSATIVAATTLVCTGTGAPSASGTLTLVSGTGDATIAFSAFTQNTNIIMSNAATSSATETVSFYSPASFIYFESDQPVSVIYNNGSPMAVNPFQINGNLQPGVLFLAGPCYSFTVTNSGTNTANLFFASMG